MLLLEVYFNMQWDITEFWVLTHWCLVTHNIIIESDNSLVSVQHQVITCAEPNDNFFVN